jgi:hypothetical protein
VPEPEGSSPHSQQPASDPYPQPGESTPHPQPISLRSILIPSSIYTLVFQVVTIFWVLLKSDNTLQVDLHAFLDTKLTGCRIRPGKLCTVNPQPEVQPHGQSSMIPTTNQTGASTPLPMHRSVTSKLAFYCAIHKRQMSNSAKHTKTVTICVHSLTCFPHILCSVMCC